MKYCVSSRDPFYSDPNTPPTNHIYQWIDKFEECGKGQQSVPPQLHDANWHSESRDAKSPYLQQRNSKGGNSTFHKSSKTSRSSTEAHCKGQNDREAPVRFGSVTVWGWKGSCGSGFRFWRFLCKRGSSVFQYSLTGRDGSGSGFGSWKTVPAVPVPLSVSGKTVPTVPVSGSGSVPEPP